MTTSKNEEILKKADWEIDFYSRPIIETTGKKRWELLISSTQDLTGSETFQWEKICPASEVNSIWLTSALKEALLEAKKQGWSTPSVLRCWRASMKTMIKRAADSIGIELIASKRTYSLTEWMSQRERDFYPNQTGYISGPLAPPPEPINNQAIPLPEALRGDKWSLASLSIGSLREAKDWPIEFNGLIPINKTLDSKTVVPGIRLFSKNRSLALAAWLGGIEPVRLTTEGSQIILEAGQSDRWLVTDIEKESLDALNDCLENVKKDADGIQFISVQSTPEEKKFAGFWMLRDIILN